MTIPKVIYQTWKTKSLHENCIKIRDNIKKLNPNYQVILYDDYDMDTFIKTNFNDYIYNCYTQLNVGAAKADFWRYCVLYINGGVYLDMDSNIVRPLDDLILEDDQCIITREGNSGIFNNWIMIFEKNHPILLESINKCCFNIMNKTTNDICYLTGPHGPFTNSINEILTPFYNKKTNNLYFENDSDLNSVLNVKTNATRCRFYGVDMGSFASFKHEYVYYLYKGHTYWRDETSIFK
uniref:Glycosyltransferase n=1 Tax=viral metagenome TaxID=1070528 RepID=A0A6C0HQ77_9ZZZZ